MKLPPALQALVPPGSVAVWRHASVVAAAILLILAASTQVLNSMEWRWRSMMIGIARSIRVVPVTTMDFPEEELPLVVLFSKNFEDPAAGVIGAEGQGAGDESGHDSNDPLLMANRAARLIQFFAAAPKDLRPAAVGFDMVFPAERYTSYPHLAAAIGQLDGVVLAVTTEASARNEGNLLSSTSDLLGAADGVGYDGFPLPAWTAPSQVARLYAPGPGWFPGGTPRPLWLALLQQAKLSREPVGDQRLMPLFYPNLYFAGPEADAVLSKRLGGYWPARSALTYVRLVPRWEFEESPAAWGQRVKRELADNAEAKLLWEQVAGRIVIVGWGLPVDAHATPFTQARYRSRFKQANEPPLTPGPVLHALAVSTYQHGRAPRDLWRNSATLAAAMAIPVAAALWLVGFGLRRRWGVLAVVAFLPGMFAIDLVATAWGNLWLPTFHILLFGFVAFFCGQVESRALFVQARDEAQQLLRSLIPSSSMAMTEHRTTTEIALGPVLNQETTWRTAMILDLAGYTQFTFWLYRKRQRQLALQLIADFFRRVIAALTEQGAEVSDLTGDGVAVIFSGEQVDQANHAVAAALAAVEATGAWRVEAAARCAGLGLNAPIPGLRIGIGGDETTARFFGTEKQLRPVFFGGAFAIAARVEQGLKTCPRPGSARYWRVAVTQAVLQHHTDGLPPGFRLHPHEPLQAKGIVEKVDISEIYPE